MGKSTKAATPSAAFKQSLLPIYRSAARQYRPLIGAHTIISCSDGFTIDVLWGKHNFIHLCGVFCDRPNTVARNGISESAYFFDRLFDENVSAKLIHFNPDDKSRVKGKSKALPFALDYNHWQGCLIVDSRLKEISWNFGNSTPAVGTEGEDIWWSIGLDAYQKQSDITDGQVYFPKSLRKQSVTKLIAKSGERHTITSVNLC